MEIIVQIILSGIVSLVPQSDGSYLVRMQDTRHWPPLSRHYPSILAESKHVTTTPTVDPAAKRPEDDPIYKTWLIGNGTLEIPGAPTDGKVDTSALVDVLTIADACPEDRKCAIIKRAFNGVELVVRGGTLRTAGLEPYRWHFSNQHVTQARRPAEEVIWEFKIAAPPLRLMVPTLFPDGEQRMVEFAVTAPHDGNIEVRLQNVPGLDLIPLPEVGHPPSIDPHVSLYFDLSTKPPVPPVELRLDQRTLPQRLPRSPHRLAGRRIVERVPGPQIETGAVKAPTAHVHPGTAEKTDDLARPLGLDIVRVNCPPALWEGMEPTSSQ